MHCTNVAANRTQAQRSRPCVCLTRLHMTPPVRNQKKQVLLFEGKYQVCVNLSDYGIQVAGYYIRYIYMIGRGPTLFHSKEETEQEM